MDSPPRRRREKRHAGQRGRRSGLGSCVEGRERRFAEAWDVCLNLPDLGGSDRWRSFAAITGETAGFRCQAVNRWLVLLSYLPGVPNICDIEVSQVELACDERSITGRLSQQIVASRGTSLFQLRTSRSRSRLSLARTQNGKFLRSSAVVDNGLTLCLRIRRQFRVFLRSCAVRRRLPVCSPSRHSKTLLRRRHKPLLSQQLLKISHHPLQQTLLSRAVYLHCFHDFGDRRTPPMSIRPSLNHLHPLHLPLCRRYGVHHPLKSPKN